MSFLDNLYQQSKFLGFSPLGQETSATDAAGFTLAKEDGTSLCLMQTIDLSRIDKDVLQFLQAKEIERASALTSMYSSICVVFLTIGDKETGTPDLSKADGYFGQSPYAIYWHVNCDTGDIFIHEDQPSDVMGLKSAILASFGSEKNVGKEFLDALAKLPAPEPVVAKPVCTIIIAVTNILMMALMYLQGFAQAPVLVAVSFGAIVPDLIWDAGQYYRLFTAVFIHFGWAHLFFNVTGMLIFGTRVERYYGSLAFFTIYFVSGLVASVSSLVLTQGISAGASGAVYGLLGAAFAYTKVKGSMDLINNQVILIYIVMGLGMSFIMPNIDYFGHIGGLVAGIFVGFGVLKLTETGRKA